MQFGTLDLNLYICEQHLDAANARNTEIENYLVQFLLVRICAEYETRIATLVERRCLRVADLHIRTFTAGNAKAICKRFSIGEIKGILGRFGDDYKQTFHDQVNDKPPHTAWDNIYSNRQAVAHGSGVQITFSDLKKFYPNSLIVLDAVVLALGLTADEINDLT
jgi:hypothetical protein